MGRSGMRCEGYLESDWESLYTNFIYTVNKKKY